VWIVFKECTLKNLKINKKEHSGILGSENASSLAWKVVADRVFEYDVRPKEKKYYNWYMQDGFWSLRSLENNGQWKRDGVGILERNTMPTNNGDFGSTHTSTLTACHLQTGECTTNT
jgi:hypothetical protein